MEEVKLIHDLSLSCLSANSAPMGIHIRYCGEIALAGFAMFSNPGKKYIVSNKSK
jgi:hypothetical protein